MNLYRPNAGIVVFRKKDGKVLLCERIENYSKRWQFPQGGIDEGETPLQAAMRELRKETSIVSVRFVKALNKPLIYDFPQEVVKKHPERKNIGQKQYWHLFLFEGDEREINLKTREPEFRAFRWIDIEDTPNLVVEFKQKVYETVAQEFGKAIRENLS